jgi:ribosomal protein S18 acetylase RimI-like enzyme
MATVSLLTKATQKAADELAALGSALHADSRTLTTDELGKLLSNENLALVVVEDDGRIVGMGSLYVIPKIGKQNAYIEDVIVDESYRGQGLGEKLVRELIDIAKQRGVKSVTLTSRSHRAAAHKLYVKLGFNTVDTNVFKLSL